MKGSVAGLGVGGMELIMVFCKYQSLGKIAGWYVNNIRTCFEITSYLQVEESQL